MVASALNSNLTNTNNSFVTAKTSRLAKPWTASNQLISFIGEWESGVLNGKNWKGQAVTEGLILTVYDDGYGIPTVGMGHRVIPNDHLKLGDKISLDKARAFARNDLNRMTKVINSKVNVPLFQYEFDAVLSVLFTSGENKGRADAFAKLLNAGQYDDVPKFIENFVNKRIPARRISEAKLFKTGIYDAKH